MESKIIQIETLFLENEEISLDARKLELFLNGVQLAEDRQDGIYRVYNDERFVGLGKIQKKLFKRDIIVDL